MFVETTEKADDAWTPDRAVRLALLAASVICAAIWLGWIRHDLASRGWPDGLLLIVATVFTIVGLTRELPLQNAITAGAAVAFLSTLVWVIGVRTRLAVPGISAWPIPMLGIVIVLNSRQVARLILRRWPDIANRGLWTIGLAGLLAGAIHLELEPLAFGIRHDSPWSVSVAALGVTVLSCVILVVILPWLINKRPHENPRLNLEPLWIWLAMDLYISAANFGAGLPDRALPGVLVAAWVGAFAVRGLRG